jgi:hypothetical protein
VPLLIDDQQRVIAGHGRLLAACKMGWDTVPAIKLSHLTESQRMAFLIADNRLIWALDERRGLFRKPPADPIQLTTGPLSWSEPIPGKDGKTIFAAGITARGELFCFDAKSKKFQPFLGGISAQGVRLSKDGQSVAYVSYPEGILWEANRDGSNPMRLSDPPIDVSSPVGRRMAPRSFSTTLPPKVNERRIGASSIPIPRSIQYGPSGCEDDDGVDDR